MSQDWRRWAAASLAGALMLGACTSTDSNDDSASEVPSDPTPPAEDEAVYMEPGGVTPFYEWDEPVPLEAGVLLRQEPLEPEHVLENAATGTRVLYSSEGWAGDPIVVSGAVLVPHGTPPEDGWPVMAWSHGTVGIADICAPSYAGRGERDTTYLNHWLDQGYAIVATDYEGLGTGGTHPYMHGTSEGYSNIDLVRAAHDLETNLSESWLVFGQSQGGQGALATGALAQERAGELDFRGTLATAPGVELLDFFSMGTDDSPVPFLGFIALLMVGMETYTPTFDGTAALTETAQPILDLVHEECLGVLIDEGIAANLTAGETFTSFPFVETPGVEDGIALMEIPESDWAQPVHLAQGSEDELLPPDLARNFARDLCEGGAASVTFTWYEGLDHSGPVNEGLGELTPWVADAFAGTLPEDSCAQLMSG